MLTIVSQRVQEAVDEIRQEAARRRLVTPSDVSVEAFDFAAARVERALREADHDSERLTPAQFGELHHVTPQTVTRWIRIGELAAESTPNGYLIACDAVRMKAAS
jgi:hypothetical protein